MIVHDVVQRSEEWFALRLGRATSSRAGDMLATGRSGKGEGKARIRYRAELVTERLTGHVAERPFSTSHTRRGQDLEATAVLAWEARTGSLVMPVGFVTHDKLMAGASPDGVVYGDTTGLYEASSDDPVIRPMLVIEATLEAKCPIQAIHYETLRSQEIVEKDHRAQLLHSIWLTGAQRGVFISYCEAFNEPDNLVAVEWEPSPTKVLEHGAAVVAFLETVDNELHARLPIAEQLNRDLGGGS